MLLGVNIDHVATLRNARGGIEPDVLTAALICEEYGATSITTHLREDRRHIKDEDVYQISKNIKTRLNLEMAMADDIQRIALDIKPHSVCIVPERRQEVTTEGGLEVANNVNRVKEFIKPLKDAGVVVSLFITPDIEQVRASKDAGADFVELHTGAYSESFSLNKGEIEFQRLKNAAEFAQSIGLRVNAGHGLNYENVYRMHEIKGLYELNIGHSIISRAIFTGLGAAVEDMYKAVKNG